MKKENLRKILFYMHNFDASFSTKQVANTCGISFNEAKNTMRQLQRDGQVRERAGKWYSRNYTS